MKKWTMLLALLLATVFCFPGALAEQEAVESTGDNGGRAGSRGIHRG